MEDLRSLIISARAGDLEAFGKITRRFQDMAYGYAYSILGDFHLAEDTAQEAFIEAYRQLHKLHTPDAFPGWFRRIVFKHCDRIVRHRCVHTVPLETAVTMEANAPGPDQIAEQIEMQERVLEAIRTLPERQRMATTLFYINGYSQKEVADFLEVSVRTVKRHLSNSREKLKERMIDMVDETLKRFPLSDDFADVVVRIVASEEELKKANKLLGTTESTIADAQKFGLFVVGKEGQIKSAGQINVSDWLIGSTIVKSSGSHAGIAGESEGVPHPIFVRGWQGYFELAKEKGCRLVMVHGSQYDHAFCGFVPCFYYPVATLPCERAKTVVTNATIAEPNKEQIQALEQARSLSTYPYATKFSAYIGNWTTHVIKQDGKVVGYADVDHNFVPDDHYAMPFGHVGGMWPTRNTTRDAALAVIRLAAELAEKVGDKEICIMQSHMTLITQTILRLGGKYLLRPSCDLVGLDAEMVAIIDLVGLTQDLRGEFQSRINASPAHHVSGRLSIEMSGTTVGFMVDSGSVRIVTQKQEVHRVLPRWVVTRLYTGYYSGEDVLTMGPLPYDRSDGKTPDDLDLDMKELHLPDNEAALFKALFPKLWPCSMPDPDVWPWVIDKETVWHYRHGDKEPEERKAQIDALRFPWIGY